MNTIIKKFMETMGITYNIEQTRRLIYAGKPSACYEVNAYHKGKKEYEQHYCYSIKSNGELTFEDANDVKGPSDGIFAYLGMNREVNNFFKEKVKSVAIHYLKSNH